MPPGRRRRVIRDTKPQSPIETPIAEMGLPTRVVNLLEEYDMILCSHLIRRTRESLLNLPGIRPRTLLTLTAAVRRLDLEPPEDWS